MRIPTGYFGENISSIGQYFRENWKELSILATVALILAYAAYVNITSPPNIPYHNPTIEPLYKIVERM